MAGFSWRTQRALDASLASVLMVSKVCGSIFSCLTCTEAEWDAVKREDMRESKEEAGVCVELAFSLR